MQLRYDIQLRAAIKSLSEVVLPAVDPGNKLAVEQIQVTIGLLSLLEQRLPLQFRYDCDELERAIEFAHGLLAQAENDSGKPYRAILADAAREGAEVLRRAGAGPETVLAAVRELRAACAAAVSEIYRDGSPAVRENLRAVVCDNAAAQLLRERAWVLPQGWEPDPAAVPPIEDLI